MADPVHVPISFVWQPTPEGIALQNFVYTQEKNAFPMGKMSIQLDRTFYYPGQVVNGAIYIHLFAAQACSSMELVVEGKEKAEFTRYWTEHHTRTRTVTNPDGSTGTETYTEAVEHHEHLKKKHKAMDFKVILMDLS